MLPVGAQNKFVSSLPLLSKLRLAVCNSQVDSICTEPKETQNVQTGGVWFWILKASDPLESSSPVMFPTASVPEDRAAELPQPRPPQRRGRVVLQGAALLPEAWFACSCLD